MILVWSFDASIEIVLGTLFPRIVGFLVIFFYLCICNWMTTVFFRLNESIFFQMFCHHYSAFFLFMSLLIFVVMLWRDECRIRTVDLLWTEASCTTNTAFKICCRVNGWLVGAVYWRPNVPSSNLPGEKRQSTRALMHQAVATYQAAMQPWP